MKALVCEMCGGTDLVKQDGMFVCQHCGIKYTVEEAKKMMIEGTVEVKGTVKIDTSDKLSNLYQLARKARRDGNYENAAKYYEQIALEASVDWEATFYSVYFKAMNCRLIELVSAASSVRNCIKLTFSLIKENLKENEQRIAYKEVEESVLKLSNLFLGAIADYVNKCTPTDSTYADLKNKYGAVMKMMTHLGDMLVLEFKDKESALRVYKMVIEFCSRMQQHSGLSKEERESIINRVKEIEPSYIAPASSTEDKGGCYVATAVYGSYDCPQVWTLRRYRDNILGKTWYGRAFIHTYYKISPCLVKWFGSEEWFKMLWKPKLDKMVEKLNEKGIVNTPYEDRKW